MTISSLIKRLEEAESGSRELDADIYEAIGYEVKRHSKRVSGAYTTRTTKAFCYLDGGRWLAMDHLSTSLDAAVALAGRLLPGWRIENLCEWDHAVLRERGPWMCDLVERGKDCTSGKSAKCAHAPTPALALCLATLRALLAQETEVGR